MLSPIPRGLCLCFLFLEEQQGTCGEKSLCLLMFPRCLEDKAQTTADIEEGGGVYSHACLGLHTVLRIGSMKQTDHGHEPDKKSIPLTFKKCCVPWLIKMCDISLVAHTGAGVKTSLVM